MFTVCLFLGIVWAFLWLLQMAFLMILRHLDRPTQEPAAINKQLPVSVVVAARNEAHNLPHLLKALCTQNYPHFEIILVNDRSEDSSESILNHWQSQYEPLKIIHIQGDIGDWDGKKNALTLGIKAAKNDIILLTDADCLPSSNLWIQKMQEPFVEPQIEIVLGCSPYKIASTWLNQFIQYETLMTAAQYLAAAHTGYAYMGVGRNLAYRKAFFERVGGLSRWQSVRGGDDDLLVGQYANDKNTSYVLDKEALTFSQAPTNYAAWRQQKRRHFNAGQHYLPKHLWRLGLLQASFWVSWALLTGLYFLPFSYFWAIVFFGALGCRFVLLGWAFNTLTKRLHINLSIFLIFIFDLANIFYYFVNLFEFLRKKPVKWK